MSIDTHKSLLRATRVSYRRGWWADTGVVAFEDDPPHGNSKMTWDEPIRFSRAVRPLVYDVYYLITATSWNKRHTDISRFYASAFWDRFKNGKTDMLPPE